MSKKSVTLILFLIALDQLTKYLVRRFLFIGEVVRMNDFLNISHVTNSGIAFGMFGGGNIVFIVITVVILTGFYLWYKKNRQRQGISETSFILINAGALGNLIDRCTAGHVTDFLDFHLGGFSWPSFNVADSCISVGGFILFIFLLKAGKR